MDFTGIANFQQSFEKVYQGVIKESPEWKRDLKQLTDETKKMVGVALKTEEMKNALAISVDKLSAKELDAKKAKEALLSIFKVIDEPQAGLMVLKTADAIAIELKLKVEKFFPK